MRSVVTVRGTCDAPLRTHALSLLMNSRNFTGLFFALLSVLPFLIIRGRGGEECRADCRGGARCAMASHLNYVVD